MYTEGKKPQTFKNTTKNSMIPIEYWGELRGYWVIINGNQ